ncbi:MAG: hypothetical protein JXA92_06345 [candidate division Zixibacteria bacterium]|nr:hypothetical protein [candidate division Zixibacteria bacterium]
MKNNLILLIVVILLYLATSLILSAVYGPSFGFLSGEDSWNPDGRGGWVKHGSPSGPPPPEPSVNIPIPVRYLPIFLPGLVLILFLFTPLSKYVDKIEKPAGPKPGEPVYDEATAEELPDEDRTPPDDASKNG